MNVLKNNLMMLKYIFKASPWFVVVVIINRLLGAVLTIMDLYITKQIINILVGNTFSFKQISLYYIIYLILYYILNQIKVFLEQSYCRVQSIKIGMYLKNILFDKIKSIDLSCYEYTEFYNNYTRAVNEIEDRGIEVVNNVANFFNYLTILLFITTIFFDPLFIISSFIIVINHLIYMKKLNKINYQFNLEITPTERFLNYIGRIFSTRDFVKEIKISNIADLFIKNNNVYCDKLITISKKYYYKTFIYSIINVILDNLTTFLIAIYISYKVISNQIIIGDFLFVINSFTTFSGNLTSVFELGTHFQNNSLYIENINKILNYISDIPENPNGNKLEYENINIEFKNVSFAYPNTPEHLILKNISVEIKNGMKIAIVGENGSGKSTFIKLLMRLYKINSGEILCNNINYEHYNLSSIHSSFSVVFQDFMIYSMSVAENILLREIKDKSDIELVWKALHFSGLDEKIYSLDKGIDTMLTKEFDDEGVYMSGGELQKLAIARASAKDYKVLIFDEPSSALDPIAEADIFNKLIKLGENKTVIYISHRLSSVIDADLILLFDNGEIIERGTHQNLIEQRGKYHQMFVAQAENYQLNEVYS